MTTFFQYLKIHEPVHPFEIDFIGDSLQPRFSTRFCRKDWPKGVKTWKVFLEYLNNHNTCSEAIQGGRQVWIAYIIFRNKERAT